MKPTSYTFYSQEWQVVGLLFSANVIHSEKNGYLLAEFGINNGEQLLTSHRKNLQAYEGALRWKSPRMKTGIDYSFRFGDGNIKTNAAGAPLVNSEYIGPVYPILSPNSQKR